MGGLFYTHIIRNPKPHPHILSSFPSLGSLDPPAKAQQGIRHGLRLRAGHSVHGRLGRLRPRRAEGEQAQGARPGGNGKVTWQKSGLDVEGFEVTKQI